MKNRERLAGQLLIDLGSLQQLASEVQDGTRTKTLSVRKPDRSSRTVHVPDEFLRFALKKLSEVLYDELPEPASHVYGFVKGRGIRQNAARHLAKPVVLRMDLANFFESISREAVLESLRENGYDDAAGSLVADLTTVSGGLAIGLNTSPVLSNLAFRNTDLRLAELADEHGFVHTRYVDDLVFSGEVPRDFVEDVARCVTAMGWTVNTTKTRYMKRGGSQYVTGLSVADPLRPRIPVRLKRRMRWKAHYIEKFGYDAYMSTFGGEDCGDHPRRLLGWARHIASIEPEVGRPLLAQFQAATSDYDYNTSDDYWEDWLSNVE